MPSSVDPRAKRTRPAGDGRVQRGASLRLGPAGRAVAGRRTLVGRLALMLVGFAVLAPFLMASKGSTQSARTEILADDGADREMLAEPSVDDVVAVSDVEADLDTFDVPGYSELT